MAKLCMQLNNGLQGHRRNGLWSFPSAVLVRASIVGLVALCGLLHFTIKNIGVWIGGTVGIALLLKHTQNLHSEPYPYYISPTQQGNVSQDEKLLTWEKAQPGSGRHSRLHPFSWPGFFYYR